MSEQQWNAVDAYLTDLLVPEDDALRSAVAASDAAGLPQIAVAPIQGKLLHLLALTQGATRILEIGTLGGYSTIWLGRALPADGQLVSLEYSAAHADVARANLARAALDKNVEVRVGPALDSLAALEAEGTAPFDFFFIDADKANNPHYVEWAVKLSRPGSVIVVDNVVRGGSVLDATSEDPAIVGTRRMFEVVSEHPRLTATAVQTVGARGYDGLLLARVTG
ncbi:O-methyltransferase [Streptomyces sp. HNM0645]|uniref:O-methyltransferase n=1 Tax=Streptomyces sp. HNM0645 TaxID=2782343 RepID=UPI0024B77733|nr:O-methyltransferase [Streptomyces sp. HNM0645]MDI9887250.1 O-methyltransferase [Streptomyces sp. HNM0645]